MSNTGNLGLAQGFMQGFNFMEGIEDRKQSRGLQMDANRRADESLQIAKDQAGRQKEEWQRQDDARLIQAMQQGLESENIDPDIASEFGERFDVDWTNYVNPQFGESIATLEGAVHGKVRMQSPEFKEAFSTVFSREINKNTGEEIGAEGGKTWIKEKRLNGVYPSPDGHGIMVDLDILEEGPKGQTRRSAPVTENRSAKDDIVKRIPLEDALKKLKGHKIIYEAVQNSPALQAKLRQYGARVGMAPPKHSDAYLKRKELIGAGIGQDEATRTAYDMETAGDEPIEINGQLVDPVTHKVLGDYRDKKGANNKNTPADVQTAEWMVANRIAPSLEVAWNRITESHTDPAKFVMDYVKQESEAQQAMFLQPGEAGYRTTEQMREEAIEALRTIRARTRGMESAVNQDADGGAGVDQSDPGNDGLDVPPVEQAPPERIQQLNDLLSYQPESRHAEIKQFFIDTFGYLPEGF